MDAIGYHLGNPTNPKFRRHHNTRGRILSCELRVDLETKMGCLDIGLGSVFAKPVVSQVIGPTDFPLAELELWFQSGVLFLPTKH